MERLVDEKAIENRLSKDYASLKTIYENMGFSFYKNEKLSGSQLFPLTLDVLNEEKDPYRVILCKTGERIPKPTFYGICPELECFFSIPLYITDKSQSSSNAYAEVQEYFNRSDRDQHILQLEGNYSISLPNKLNVWNGKITLIRRERNLYDWFYAPFLKVNSETFEFYISPIYYQEILLPNESSEFVPYKTVVDCTAGYILEKNGTAFLVKLPSFRTSRPRIVRLKLENNTASIHANFQQGDVIQMLLFRKMYKKNKKLIEETTIGKIRKIDPEDLIVHILASDFYYQYLERGSLELFEYAKINEYFIQAIKKSQAFIKKKIELTTISADFLLLQYINTYFRKIQNKVYYIPYLFRKYSDKQIVEIEKTRMYLTRPNFLVTKWSDAGNSVCSVDGKPHLAKLCKKKDYLFLMVTLKQQQEVHRTALNVLKQVNTYGV